MGDETTSIAHLGRWLRSNPDTPQPSSDRNTHSRRQETSMCARNDRHSGSCQRRELDSQCAELLFLQSMFVLQFLLGLMCQLDWSFLNSRRSQVFRIAQTIELHQQSTFKDWLYTPSIHTRSSIALISEKQVGFECLSPQLEHSFCL